MQLNFPGRREEPPLLLFAESLALLMRLGSSRQPIFASTDFLRSAMQMAYLCSAVPLLLAIQMKLAIQCGVLCCGACDSDRESSVAPGFLRYNMPAMFCVHMRGFQRGIPRLTLRQTESPTE